MIGNRPNAKQASLLRSGRVSVAGCRGYNVTFTLYRHYGYGAWRWAFCCQAFEADRLLMEGAELPTGARPYELDEPEAAACVSAGTDRDSFIGQGVGRFLALVASETRCTGLLRERYGELGRVLGVDCFEQVFCVAPEARRR